MSGICSKHREHDPNCRLCCVLPEHFKGLLREAFEAGALYSAPMEGEEVERLFEQWYAGRCPERQEPQAEQTFLMDKTEYTLGTKHYAGKNCWCQPQDACPVCGSIRHYQRTHRGYLEWCETCDKEKIEAAMVKV